MKKLLITCIIGIGLLSCSKQASITSPDGKLSIHITNGKQLTYSVSYEGKTILEPAPLGLNTSAGNFSTGLELHDAIAEPWVDIYRLNRSKASEIGINANKLTLYLTNQNNDSLQVVFVVKDNDIAFRYRLAAMGKDSCEIFNETTAFDFPAGTKTIITPQAPWGEGWKLSKPSYEEEYTYFEEMGTPSKYGVGYTFPALFHTPDSTWILLSETGVDGRYAGCKLGEGNADGVYPIAFPEPEENRGIGSNTIKAKLPAYTSWKTITIGKTLEPIVETTIMFDVVEPQVEATASYKPGKSTWSWILWQDGSMNYNDQKTFIDLAAAMDYEYILIDALWDTQVGYERMPELIRYAQNKGVDVLLWYNSNGQWNDAPQGPKNRMDTPEARRKEMAWMQQLGVKGIKVDFFGGDKQCTMQLYEDILRDAAHYGLAVNFHGTTIPRGWERMYPNYMCSEAILASENLVFQQSFADQEAYWATIIPYTRNAIGSMDFGPVFFSKRFSKGKDWGNIRKTTDAFQLATAVLYHSAIQHFGLVPDDLKEQPDYVIDFMKNVPTTWDDTQFIDGYPGKLCVIARKNNKKWYVAGVNGENTPKEITLHLPMMCGHYVSVYHDNDQGGISKTTRSISNKGELTVQLKANGGIVIED